MSNGVFIKHNLVGAVKTVKLQILRTALRFHFKQSQPFDFVIKQINTQRLFGSVGKNVDDISPYGIFARFHNLLNAGIAVDCCIVQKFVKIKFPANLDVFARV